MIKVLSYLKTYIGAFLCAIGLLFVQAICDLELPDYMSDIINIGVLNGNLNFIWETGGKMLVITLIGSAASIVVSYIASKIAAGVAKNIRYDLFKKIESFSNAEFDLFSSSSLITRTTNDITQIQTFYVMMIKMMFYAPIIGIGGVIKALSNSKSMSWILLIAVIALIGLIVLIALTVIPKMQKMQKLVDRLNLVVRENLDGILVMRAFNSQKFEENRFDKANVDLTKTSLFVNRFGVLIMPAMTLIMNFTTIAIVWVGSKQVCSFETDIGSMMAYMQYGLQVILAFLMLSAMFILIPRASVSANRIKEVLEVKNSILDPKNPKHFDNKKIATVEFCNVSFAYPGSDECVLHDINFTAKPGETTAFIGSTGSGKSTLVNLVMRFYDVTKGEIKINGINIKDVTLKELHDMVGFVPQKSILFSGDIESNLRYADKNSSMENLRKATRIAQADEYIFAKPKGYQTPVSQGGTNVSGGQKQRLAIARALVKNAPINVFDDSFSALDMKTDKNLRAAIKEEISESTILLVGQRIASIMDANQIVVLDNGYIVGIGTHKELLKNCEVYREIATSQLSEEELSR